MAVRIFLASAALALAGQAARAASPEAEAALQSSYFDGSPKDAPSLAVQVPATVDVSSSTVQPSPRKTQTAQTVSLAAAAGVTSFVAYRYITAGAGNPTNFLGQFGQAHLNDALTPIGFTAAGYLVANALYGEDDKRDGGGRVQSAMVELPVLGFLGGLAYELGSGAGIFPGAFSAGSLLFYGAGAVAAALLVAALSSPPSSGEGHRWGAGLLPAAIGGGLIIAAKLAAAAFLGPAAAPLLGIGLLAAALLS